MNNTKKLRDHKTLEVLIAQQAIKHYTAQI